MKVATIPNTTLTMFSRCQITPSIPTSHLDLSVMTKCDIWPIWLWHLIWASMIFYPRWLAKMSANQKWPWACYLQGRVSRGGLKFHWIPLMIGLAIRYEWVNWQRDEQTTKRIVILLAALAALLQAPGEDRFYIWCPLQICLHASVVLFHSLSKELQPAPVTPWFEAIVLFYSLVQLYPADCL